MRSYDDLHSDYVSYRAKLMSLPTKEQYQAASQQNDPSDTEDTGRNNKGTVAADREDERGKEGTGFVDRQAGAGGQTTAASREERQRERNIILRRQYGKTGEETGEETGAAPEKRTKGDSCTGKEAGEKEAQIYEIVSECRWHLMMQRVFLSANGF